MGNKVEGSKVRNLINFIKDVPTILMPILNLEFTLVTNFVPLSFAYWGNIWIFIFKYVFECAISLNVQIFILIFSCWGLFVNSWNETWYYLRCLQTGGKLFNIWTDSKSIKKFYFILFWLSRSLFKNLCLQNQRRSCAFEPRSHHISLFFCGNHNTINFELPVFLWK